MIAKTVSGAILLFTKSLDVHFLEKFSGAGVLKGAYSLFKKCYAITSTKNTAMPVSPLCTRNFDR
jgi:ethanolamine utilization microcompartment shell protein EutS